MNNEVVSIVVHSWQSAQFSRGAFLGRLALVCPRNKYGGISDCFRLECLRAWKTHQGFLGSGKFQQSEVGVMVAGSEGEPKFDLISRFSAKLAARTEQIGASPPLPSPSLSPVVIAFLVPPPSTA